MLTYMVYMVKWFAVVVYTSLVVLITHVSFKPLKLDKCYGKFSRYIGSTGKYQNVRQYHFHLYHLNR